MYNLQSKVYVKLLCLALYAAILIPGQTIFAADICTDGLKELQGSQGVIQDKGGIWGYLEQSKPLSSKSLLGLQIELMTLCNYIIQSQNVMKVVILNCYLRVVFFSESTRFARK